MDWHYRAGLCIVALVLQVATGLFSVDIDGMESGPLSYVVSFDGGRMAAEIHSASFVAIQALVVLHLLAIAFYRLGGRGLMMPMITGRDPQVVEPREENMGGGAFRALVTFAAASGLAWWFGAGAPL